MTDPPKPASATIIVCAACGNKYGPDDDHPCLRKAQAAEAERLAGWPDGEPDPVEHQLYSGVVRNFEDGQLVDACGRKAHARVKAPRPLPVGTWGWGDLAYYRDDGAEHDGTAGQHLCLCARCNGWLKKQWGLALWFLGYAEGNERTSRTLLDTDGEDAWRADVDGCDLCGLPPRGRPGTRRGPSEWFAILYLGEVDPPTNNARIDEVRSESDARQSHDEEEGDNVEH
ncbi:MAG: hypothetical protein JRD89_09115 [Deltaproteobacteria bacterium]|nr:hypothetical protein [Deltaproteobacteria bacterium]